MPLPKPSEPDAIDLLLKHTGQAESGTTRDQVKDLGDGTYVMSYRLMFHWTMIRGFIDDYTGFFDRWCFETRELAMSALADFPLNPPGDYEPKGWHRHPPSARRRPGGDPTQEYRDG
jgi:hypothetical protein